VIARGPLTVEERARAKINLALRIHGKRADGYHEIETLIAFADVADVVRVKRGHANAPLRSGITVTGPYAAAIAGENLMDRALALVEAAAPDLAPDLASLNIELEKHLPVAAGLGGGSADAAALLRALGQLFPDATAGIDWLALAGRLGADVPACFNDRPAIARGRGTELSAAPWMRPHPIVLINANAAPLEHKTPRVFRALAAGPCPPVVPMVLARRGDLHTPADMTHDQAYSWLRDERNDLEPPAAALMPEVARVLSALRDAGAPLARLSGAGPTCFALFAPEQDAAANDLANRLMTTHPTWWVVSGTVS
jgi:4-diphosphocytidyl-2-C-methyl-D-erythritol kinase